MTKHSVIFIEHTNGEYERLGREKGSYSKLLLVSMRELPRRVMSAFIPPLLGPASRKVYVDLVGPLLALSLLAITLHIGHTSHDIPFVTSPTAVLLIYLAVVPPLVVTGATIGCSSLAPSQVFALLGYGLYGPLLTVLTSLILPTSGHSLFFTSFSIFGGLTSFRIAVVLLFTIPSPPVRFLLCTLTSIANLLFIIFIHYAYMHKSFNYPIAS